MIRQHLKVPYLLALMFGALFVAVTTCYSMGWTDRLDSWVLQTLRSDTADLSGGNQVYWIEIMRDITSLAGIGLVVIIFVLTAVYLLLRRQWRAAVLAVVLIAGTQISVTSLKLFIARPRPDLVDHGAHVATHSFPSGHSSMAAALALMLAWTAAIHHHENRLRAYCWIVGGFALLAVGFSRVYLGVHWVSDVLGGWCVGAFWACVCIGLAEVLRTRGQAVDRAMQEILPEDPCDESATTPAPQVADAQA